ncbi:MAG: proline racemase family protein [Rhodothermia bacterium]|nr:proline racemase family protein [Rhodothermia bacterium]
MRSTRLKTQALRDWSPPAGWLALETIDAHTGGEPLRVITAGYPVIEGDDMLAKRRYLRARLDHLRKALMWEPRGHADMYGCLITDAVSAEAHFGVLFLHNEGYSSMCGHGIIAVTKIVLETGMFEMKAPVTELRIDTPAGMVTAYARVEAGNVKTVYFHNVPSFVVELDAVVAVPGLGDIRYDLAFGGAYYAYVNASDAEVDFSRSGFRELIEKGMAIKKAVTQSRRIQHPFDDDLGFLYGTIFIGPARDSDAHSRNVCVFAEGEVDRSPTGTGVSGRAAIHHARGQLGIREPIVIESIVGSRFSVQVVETTSFGPYDAIVPEVEGRAFITGRHHFYVDPADPMAAGFMLR